MEQEQNKKKRNGWMKKRAITPTFKDTKMTITVQIKSVYGNETIYPVCAKAQALANLAGTKTLTPSAIAQIKALGFDVQIQQQSI